jgi:hypothetical protein
LRSVAVALTQLLIELQPISMNVVVVPLMPMHAVVVLVSGFARNDDRLLFRLRCF